MNWLARIFSTDPGEPTLLDHVRVAASDNGPARHEAKLAEAARRYGKPFKCAGDGVPREVQRDGHFVTVGGNVTRLPTKTQRSK